MLKLRFGFFILMALNVVQSASACNCDHVGYGKTPFRDLKLITSEGQKITPLTLGLYDAQKAIRDLMCALPPEELSKYSSLIIHISKLQSNLNIGYEETQTNIRSFIYPIARELPVLVSDLKKYSAAPVYKEYFGTHLERVSEFQRIIQ